MEQKTFLYVKLHTGTGMKYFGKTVQDVYKYKGSGKYWSNHIEKHGTEKVITLKVWEFTDVEKCKAFAIKFSLDNKIITSSAWANLIDENGIDGGSGSANPMFGKTHSLEIRQKLSQLCSGRTGYHWYNDGTNSIFTSKAPDDKTWSKGRIWDNAFKGKTHTEELKQQLSKQRQGISSPKTKRDGYEKFIYTVYWVNGLVETTTNLSTYAKKHNLKLNLPRFAKENPPKSKTLIKIEKALKA